MSTLIHRRSFLLLVVLLLGAPRLSGQTCRVDTLVRAPLAQYPVNIAFVPDGSGRFFFTEKNSGKVRVYQHRLLPDAFLTVPVESEGEQGLLGITCHPAYADSPFVFVFYVRAVDRLGIVERYRDSAGIGVEPRQILIIPRLDNASEHIGGALRFGPDRKLYVAVGDHKTSLWNAQDTSFAGMVWGKILRINIDGSIPGDNPSPRKAFWAWGLRSCEGMAFDSTDGALYCTDGGVGHTNRIFRVRQGGGNLGWPRTSAPDPPAGIQPLLAFPEERSPALTGIAIYGGDAFPSLRGRLLVAGNAIPALWVSTYPARSDSLLLERFFSIPTGCADVQVGPDGCIYLTNGPLLSGKILRLSPVAPRFASTPAPDAVQGIPYSYTPVFTGTPPEIMLLEGPDGMIVDSSTGRVLWTPTNTQAHARSFQVTLGAQNGAGSVQQRFKVRVSSNDPPGSFNLDMATGAEVLNFLGTEPHVTFRWAQTNDPDGDSVSYVVELDSTVSFDSPAHRVFPPGRADSLHVSLPRISCTYYWRVSASDGRLSTPGIPPYATLSVTFLPTPGIKVAAERPTSSPLEQNFPNPFNPSTSISYFIQRQGYVRLSIYNLLGQEVSRVFEGIQDEGRYVVAFNNLTLPSGIYFYRLQAPGLFETKKMIIAQ